MSRKIALLLIALALLASLGLLWQWLAARDLLDATTLYALMQGSLSWRDSPWAGAIVVGAYLVASLTLFPMSVLVVLAGLLFGPVWGFIYSFAGTLAGSVVTYWLGRRLGRDALMRHGGTRLQGLSRYLAGRGIRTMTLVSLLPLAPFTLTNMMAGAFHIRFRDYMLGTVIGLTPGLAAIILLGSQLGSLLTAENRQELAWSAGGIAAGIALLYGLKRWADWRRKRRKHRS
ncbi:TVP38/TMEM64 family protein [Billgrantia bachuensis]|uniref:TVP38/TMEM64 family membrane protein n=1 Tax=Billgrantia bachuensis TaxID=2717286 RepID=A0ABX0PR18_9GAMM|nr:TVP38/TMEM64 family protein [Halomonas bachuensis]NIC05568.1 TVP38/TMEM64 family protein [Halomonas bachuensis]